MKRFRFKLETVLKVRKSKEDEQLRTVAVAQGQLQDRIEYKKTLLNEIQEAQNRYNQLGNSRELNVQDLAIEDLFISGNKQRSVGAEHQILRAQKKVNQEMARYLLARKDRKTVDRLKENALNEFNELNLKIENRRMDDLMIMRERLKKEDESE